MRFQHCVLLIPKDSDRLKGKIKLSIYVTLENLDELESKDEALELIKTEFERFKSEGSMITFELTKTMEEKYGPDFTDDDIPF